jgi:hypothetical protein
LLRCPPERGKIRREARLRVDHRAGGRSNSRLPAAVDLLAAPPLLSISALAEAL